MKRGIVLVLLLAAGLAESGAQEQRRDRGVFVEPKNEFADSISRSNEAFRKKPRTPARQFRVDFGPVNAPKAPEEFTRAWHTPPVSQGNSGMCWCFATTSFFESEIYRLTRRQIKLSELHTVYWEYVEKARRFVRERGNSEFREGSEANAVTRIWKTYGVVPAEAYTGLQPGQKFHDHSGMFAEMHRYLRSLRESGAWNEEQVVATIRSILDHTLGAPPATVHAEGKSLTPREYLAQVVRINPDDYVDVMSLLESPYNRRALFNVPDNWWRDSSYQNVPLDLFVGTIREAAKKGYTVAIGGDVSEAGYEGHAGIGVIPSFDIPSSFIDEYARQFRFSNSTSTDDHFIHLVGVTERDGRTWYLIKDSASGSRNSTHPGYYFYDEDYITLKILCFLVHKDAAREILSAAGR
jgi:bleomycin hydrolase